MLGYLRRNAIAYLALFVALSGTAYAFQEVNKNAVGTRQLKRGAVHAPDIAKGAVLPKHLGFPLGTDGAGIPDTSVAQGAEPHLFPAVKVNDGNLMITGAVQVTNPAAPPGSPTPAAVVTLRMLFNNAPIGSFKVTVPDGQTQTLPIGLQRAAASGFQEVNELKPDIVTAGANINVDGGSYAVLIGPADPAP